MSKYIDADKLKAEIERRKCNAELGKNEAEGISSLNYNIHLAEENLCLKLLFFIDSLPEQPVKGISMEWRSLPSSWDFQKEQPVLEEELKRYINSDEYINTPENGTLLIARHFAEWGAEQKDIELFRKQNCKNCGSQRCTGEGEWLEGCEKFREWKDKA